MSEMEPHYGSVFYIKNIIVDIILCSTGHLKVNDNDQFVCGKLFFQGTKVMMFEGINQRVKLVLKPLVQICSIVVCIVICLM
jgi:hypothetical protein